MTRNPFCLNLRYASWKRLNELMQPALGHAHLLAVCTCRRKSGNPGPHHKKACPCYATHRVKILRCKGVYKQVIWVRKHQRTILEGPVEFHLEEIS